MHVLYLKVKVIPPFYFLLGLILRLGALWELTTMGAHWELTGSSLGAHWELVAVAHNHHRKSFATGVNFDDDGIEKKLARGGDIVGSFGSLVLTDFLCTSVFNEVCTEVYRL